MQKDVIIDADPGIDDALAIAMAVYSNNLNVKLLTSVCGNVTIDKITKNMLDLLQALEKRDIPVAIGAEKPLARKKDNSIQVHGKSGLGDWKFPKCELKAVKENAVEKMYEILSNSSNKITIIALGPLTNIAELLIKHPDIKTKIACVLFSGGLMLDNQNSRYFGFNIMQDPESADIVWKSGVNIVVCPSDHGHYGYLTKEEIVKTRKLNKTGYMFSEIFRKYKDTHVKVGIAIHDLCAVVMVSNPEIFRIDKMNVEVVFHKKENNALLDFSLEKEPNALVATNMDIKKFKKIYFKTLRKMP